MLLQDNHAEEPTRLAMSPWAKWRELLKKRLTRLTRPLEPLGALSLACNITQILGAAKEGYSMFKRLMDTGEAYPALHESAAALKVLSQNLQASLTRTPHPAGGHQETLLKLACSCQSSAEKLGNKLKEAAGTATATKGNKAKSMKAVITLKIHQHKLETLEKEMRKYRACWSLVSW